MNEKFKKQKTIQLRTLYHVFEIIDTPSHQTHTIGKYTYCPVATLYKKSYIATSNIYPIVEYLETLGVVTTIKKGRGRYVRISTMGTRLFELLREVQKICPKVM